MHSLWVIAVTCICLAKDEGIAVAQMLKSLLDRKHMMQGKAAPYPSSGVGYELIRHAESRGLLSAVE